MGGGGIEIEEPHSLPGPRTMVLMGRAGNGKSATGNSILGTKAFISKRSSGGVTDTAQCHSINLKNGQTVNIIDTPGLFDFSVGSETISKEIVKCVGLARDGIHAVLLVFSIRGRFTEEEESVIKTLQTFFGPKITEYMIMVFTGGDDLEEGESLDEYLGQDCPEPLKNMVEVCKNRCVLFDNKTKDEKKKELQLEKLMSLVDDVIEQNGGQPYTDSMFAESREAAELQQKKEEANASKGHTKEELAELTDQIQKSYDDQLKRMTQMVETKLKVTNEKLIKELEREKTAREKAEKDASEVRKKAKELEREKTAREKAEKDASEARKKAKELERGRTAREKAEKDASEARKKAKELERERTAREKAEKDASEARKKAENDARKWEEERNARRHAEHNLE